MPFAWCLECETWPNINLKLDWHGVLFSLLLAILQDRLKFHDVPVTRGYGPGVQRQGLNNISCNGVNDMNNRSALSNGGTMVQLFPIPGPQPW
eukprot:16438657-Heterocapsa_arctica.AAC.1